MSKREPNLKIRLEPSVGTFRKEEIPYNKLYYIDPKNDKRVGSKELDHLNETIIQNLYRKKYKIPFPDKIKSIRVKYGLSPIKMSEVLGMGVNSYRNYESGEVPSLANANLIKLSSDRDKFKAMASLACSQGIISEEELNFISKKDTESIDDYNFISIWNIKNESSEFTGFVEPSYEKMANVVLFFIDKVNPYITKLNKLLFYSDFFNYRKTGYSITGCNYRAINYGPVPSMYGTLYDLLEANQSVSKVYESFSDTSIQGERLIKNKEFDRSVFSNEEFATLCKVAETFKDTKTREIIEISHNEPAWIDNSEMKELIDYKYAFYLDSGLTS